MASVLSNTFISSQRYNSLPHIQDVYSVPQDHAKDITDLGKLLEKHRVPQGVSIRLIHKHYDTTPGEVVIFREFAVFEHGIRTCRVMKPVNIAEEAKHPDRPATSRKQQLQGIHYYVDGVSNTLQAYEYADCEIINMTEYQDFLNEFCSMINERGLQHKFGLKLERPRTSDPVDYSEFEVDGQRTTVTFYGEASPLPLMDSAVTTEWQKPLDDSVRKQRKTTKHSCDHSGPAPYESLGDDGIRLSGRALAHGTNLYNLVTHVLAITSC